MEWFGPLQCWPSSEIKLALRQNGGWNSISCMVMHGAFLEFILPARQSFAGHSLFAFLVLKHNVLAQRRIKIRFFIIVCFCMYIWKWIHVMFSDTCSRNRRTKDTLNHNCLHHGAVPWLGDWVLHGPFCGYDLFFHLLKRDYGIHIGKACANFGRTSRLLRSSRRSKNIMVLRCFKWSSLWHGWTKEGTLKQTPCVCAWNQSHCLWICFFVCWIAGIGNLNVVV